MVLRVLLCLWRLGQHGESVTVHPWIRKHLYWICQLGGWGCLGLTLTLFGLIEDNNNEAEVVLQNVVFAGSCLAGTHWLRVTIRRRHWLSLRPKPALLRIIPAMMFISLIFAVGLAMIVPIALRSSIEDDPTVPLPLIVFLLIMIIWLNLLIMYVGWTAIFLGYKVTQRNHQLETERLRLQAAAKEAELRALRSQINPHFLFNSLNSLSSLICEDTARANQAVLHLAQMLRYNLRATRSELVPLSQELQVVEGYLALEKIRFEDRLEIRYEIDPGARSGLIPPFLLQHLIENAIKYGIARRKLGGELHVAARVEQGILTLCVSNPGELAETGASTGTGLQNARERLALLFGEAAQLSVENGPDSTVIAEACLPFHTEFSLQSSTADESPHC